MSEADTAVPGSGAPRTRSVVAKGERVPWPRRLIATGLLAAVFALALHALPRPYQQIPTGVVRGLGDSYGNLRSSYRNEVAALEPVAGEASAAERTAYARELWRYRWFGSFREILLRFAEWLSASCLFVALGLIVVERRRTQRALSSRTGETLLRHETLAGDPIVTPSPAPEAAPVPPVPTAPTGPSAQPGLARGAVPLRETGDEVTPPSPTPIPSGLQLRPAAVPAPFDDDDDLARATESQAPNLAKRPIPAGVTAAVPASPPGLPVFFAERRHPDAHPVVHPGDPAPAAEPSPTPPPTTTAPLAAAPVTPTATPVVPAAESPTPAALSPAASANDNPGWWPKRGE